MNVTGGGSAAYHRPTRIIARFSTLRHLRAGVGGRDLCLHVSRYAHESPSFHDRPEPLDPMDPQDLLALPTPRSVARAQGLSEDALGDDPAPFRTPIGPAIRDCACRLHTMSSDTPGTLAPDASWKAIPGIPGRIVRSGQADQPVRAVFTREGEM